jgi:DNA repair protein RecN (Recombination protein N)
MHGPHDHQSLLNAAFQLNLLDAFARLEGPLTDYQDAYRLMRDLEDRRQALDGDDQQVVRQIDLLSFQVREIESAAPVDGEDAQIEKEQALIANAQRILQLAEAIRNALTEGENAAFGHLTFVQKAFAELIPLEPTASAWRDEARSIAIQLQELASDISRYAQHMDADPQRLQWLEDRMALYHKLKRKYGATVPQILEHLAQAKQQLHDLETRGEQIAKIETQLAAARKVVMDLGRQLGKRRRAAAEKLAAAITKELRDLGFKDGSFHVELREGEPTASGTDEIEFGFAPNVGESLRPLRAIASSGEISRVMLAVKAVLAAHDPIPVLVFDEIDINIGGETANAVGAKLAEVARNHQVLCITHLPQVAIHGTAHFAVSKEVSGNRTRTQIRQLDMEQRAEEIARMLGGKDLTSVTLKHAREMIRNVPSSRR